MSVRPKFWILFTLGFTLCSSLSAAAQAPGYADLSYPTSGEAVAGLVTLVGSASHPFFTEYDLAFSYQDDPSDTWFFIAEHVKQEVQNDPLGIWDTTGITDGVYRVRLRVFLQGRETLIVYSEKVRLRNYSRIETATPSPIGIAELPTVTLPTSTPRPTPLPVLSGNGNQMVIRSFSTGIILGILALVGGAFYLVARRQIRIRMGVMRTRRMLWQEERERRKQA